MMGIDDGYDFMIYGRFVNGGVGWDDKKDWKMGVLGVWGVGGFFGECGNGLARTSYTRRSGPGVLTPP